MSCGALVTVRLKSTRLPGKALLPLAGRPLLSHLVDRLRASDEVDRIVLATSDLPGDDGIVDLARRMNVEAFRGDPDDVLARIRDAGTHHGFETIVSVTGDNPLVDPGWIDRLVRFHRRGRYDYSRVSGLPFGTFSYVLDPAAVKRACALAGTTETEVWGGYFTETDRFRCGVLQVDEPELRWPDLRLTVDTPEDYDAVAAIFDALQRSPDEVIGLREVVRLCRERPEIPARNRRVVQKPPPPIKVRGNQE